MTWSDSSYGDPGSPVAAAAGFVQHTLTGSLAVAAAVVAVAGIGLLMLSGRLDLRRSVSVVAGAFIIFGAATIAAGVTMAIFGSSDPSTDVTTAPPPAPFAPAPPPQPAAAITDPYAGAAVPRR